MMEPKVGETFVFGEINPAKFPNKSVFSVKEVDMEDGGWVVLSCSEMDDWHISFPSFYENFTKV